MLEFLCLIKSAAEALTERTTTSFKKFFAGVFSVMQQEEFWAPVNQMGDYRIHPVLRKN